MKQRFSQILILAIVLLPLAFTARGYTAPTAAPTGGNTDGPLTVGSVDEVKLGGLSVNAFHATGGALFVQDAYLQGFVRGGTPTTTLPIAVTTDVAVSGNVMTKNAVSTTLAGTGIRPLCATAAGTYAPCTVGAAGPTVHLTATPVTSANKSKLTWTSSGATSCTGTNFSTGAGSPTVSTGTGVGVTITGMSQTYSIACTGAGGTAYDSVTLTISDLCGSTVGSCIAGATASSPVTTYVPGNTSTGGGLYSTFDSCQTSWTCTAGNGTASLCSFSSQPVGPAGTTGPEGVPGSPC